jgi:hypothetical protein
LLGTISFSTLCDTCKIKGYEFWRGNLLARGRVVASQRRLLASAAKLVDIIKAVIKLAEKNLMSYSR